MKTIELNGNRYTFVTRFENTRNVFKHVCELYKNDIFVNGATRHYLNRTWERYVYQDVMINSVINEMNNVKVQIEEDYKNDMGIKRITAKHKNAIFNLYAQNSELNELTELKNLLK